MKRVIIVHGWDSNPNDAWFPWLKAELEKRGFKVEVPVMPHPAEPTITDWVGTLGQVVGKADTNTFFVGHSIGCQTILRYLATLPKGSQVGGVVFVAGWFNLSNALDEKEQEVAKEWVNSMFDVGMVRTMMRQSAAIFSETDIWVPIENKKLFEDRLSSKTFIEKCGGEGHFSGSDGAMELPKALELILAMSTTPLITIDDLAKIEIKIGTIVEAARVEGADKLLKFKIDFGSETRTIISGVAKVYAPEVMLGKQVPVVMNLAPRKMKGVESQGMALYAIDDTIVDGTPQHKPIMLNPEQKVPNGSLVQ